MQTNFNKLYGSSPLIGLNYMQKLNDPLESSKQLPSVKLSTTYEAFSFPNQITNKYCSFQLLSLNIKSKTKNTSGIVFGSRILDA